MIFMVFYLLGDDCVAIKRNSYNINVTYVTCGPGHGIRFAHIKLIFKYILLLSILDQCVTKVQYRKFGGRRGI